MVTSVGAHDEMVIIGYPSLSPPTLGRGHLTWAKRGQVRADTYVLHDRCFHIYYLVYSYNPFMHGGVRLPFYWGCQVTKPSEKQLAVAGGWRIEPRCVWPWSSNSDGHYRSLATPRACLYLHLGVQTWGFTVALDLTWSSWFVQLACTHILCVYV